MNLDDIDSVWRSPHNQPQPAQLEAQRMKLVAELERRYRASRGLLWITLIPLLVVTGKILLHLVWPAPAHTPLDLGREWGVLPLVALPWAGWFLMLRLHLRLQARHHDYDRSIRASLAAALDENRTERLRCKIVGGVLLLSIPLLGLVLHQLRAVGKVGHEIVFPAYVLWPSYVVLMIVWFAWDHQRRMMPRKRALEGLLSDYQRGEARPDAAS